MIQYLIKRILLFIPTLFVITLISFCISRLAPGDPAMLKAGVGSEGAMSATGGLNEKIVEMVRKQWHLDKPIWQQYIIWTGGLCCMDFASVFEGGNTDFSKFSFIGHPDFGTSFQDNRPVFEKMVERVPITLSMNLIAVFLAYLIAVPLGMYSATHQDTLFDRTSTFLLFAMYSLPVFWVGTMAVTFLCSYEYLSIFPSTGIRSTNFSDTWTFWEKLMDYGAHLALPIIIYTYGSFAFISRQMRSAMLETVRQDYIRTARAKGLSERVVITKHALRNSLIPIITLLAGILPGLIGGSVIVETIFSIPGMGELSFKALVARDYPMIMAVFTISAVLTLAGILVSDILYSFADPRIAFSKKNS
ncbi:MAG: ABC transporter permease [Ignavibacteria bacterium]|nr:ABC transporter permease [Ignavibacteria bacterium]